MYPAVGRLPSLPRVLLREKQPSSPPPHPESRLQQQMKGGVIPREAVRTRTGTGIAEVAGGACQEVGRRAVRTTTIMPLERFDTLGRLLLGRGLKQRRRVVTWRRWLPGRFPAATSRERMDMIAWCGGLNGSATPPRGPTNQAKRSQVKSSETKLKETRKNGGGAVLIGGRA